jgi:hypothetical protein
MVYSASPTPYFISNAAPLHHCTIEPPSMGEGDRSGAQCTVHIQHTAYSTHQPPISEPTLEYSTYVLYNVRTILYVLYYTYYTIRTILYVLYYTYYTIRTVLCTYTVYVLICTAYLLHCLFSALERLTRHTPMQTLYYVRTILRTLYYVRTVLIFRTDRCPTSPYPRRTSCPGGCS